MSDVKGSDNGIGLQLSEDDLQHIPEEIRERILTYSQRFEMIQSPLLPPKLLQEYDQVIPGLSEKLVEWTENETRHRHDLDNQSFNEVRSLRSRAQIFGFIVAITGLLSAGAIGIAAALYSSSSAAVLGGVLAIVSVGGPFAARILAGRFKSSD